MMTELTMTLSEKTQQALAGLALEDMHPSKELLAGIAAFDQGGLSKKELLARTFGRKI